MLYRVEDRLYFLWHLIRKSLEGKMSNIGGHPFGVVDSLMQADSLMEFFLFDSSCLGEVTGSTKGVVVVKMVVRIVKSMVSADLGVLLEVVILV